MVCEQQVFGRFRVPEPCGTKGKSRCCCRKRRRRGNAPSRGRSRHKRTRLAPGRVKPSSSSSGPGTLEATKNKDDIIMTMMTGNIFSTTTSSPRNASWTFQNTTKSRNNFLICLNLKNKLLGSAKYIEFCIRACKTTKIFNMLKDVKTSVVTLKGRR